MQFLAGFAAVAATPPARSSPTPSAKANAAQTPRYSREYEAILRSAEAFKRVKSFRTRVQTEGGIVLADYVAPDRYHIRTLTEEAFVVGKQAYALSAGSYVPADLPFGDFVIDLVKDPGIMPQWARLSPPVFVANDTVEGVPSKVYRFLSASKNNQAITTVWIGQRDHLPHRVTIDSIDAHVLVQYLGYNEPMHFGP